MAKLLVAVTAIPAKIQVMSNVKEIQLAELIRLGKTNLLTRQFANSIVGANKPISYKLLLGDNKSRNLKRIFMSLTPQDLSNKLKNIINQTPALLRSLRLTDYEQLWAGIALGVIKPQDVIEAFRAELVTTALEVPKTAETGQYKESKLQVDIAISEDAFIKLFATLANAGINIINMENQPISDTTTRFIIDVAYTVELYSETSLMTTLLKNLKEINSTSRHIINRKTKTALFFLKMMRSENNQPNRDYPGLLSRIIKTLSENASLEILSIKTRQSGPQTANSIEVEINLPNTIASYINRAQKSGVATEEYDQLMSKIQSEIAILTLVFGSFKGIESTGVHFLDKGKPIKPTKGTIVL